MQKDNIHKKELLIFLAITFGLVYLMEVPLALISYSGDIELIIYAQMCLPAAGLMLSKLLCIKDKSLLPKKLFVGYILMVGIAIIIGLVNFFTSIEFDFMPTGMTIILFILFFWDDNAKLKAFGLGINKLKESFIILLLYIVLFTGTTILTFYFVLDEFSFSKLENIYVFPIGFIFSLPFLLGEKYGWRVYFQPYLQEKFGLRKGVLIFGLLWEIWHIPFVLLYMAPQVLQMGLYESLGQIFFYRLIHVPMIAIFMAYAYMKTNNVWLAAIIHGFHNYIMYLYMDFNEAGKIFEHGFTWTTLGIVALIELAVFLPFLGAKVFKKQQIKNREQKVIRKFQIYKN